MKEKLGLNEGVGSARRMLIVEGSGLRGIVTWPRSSSIRLIAALFYGDTCKTASTREGRKDSGEMVGS